MDFSRRDSLTRAGLNLIQQALSIYDEDLRLVLCNRQFREMFALPNRLTKAGAPFQDTIRHLVETGEYGPIDDTETAIHERVAQALTFRPHYFERTRSNGRVISVEGAPLPQGGWVTVYTDITDIKRQEELLRARSAELSGQLINHAEDLAAANRKLQATNAALEEARGELTQMEARIRLTTEMMPAHIAHISPRRTYNYSNRRLNAIMPGRPSNILGLHMADVLGAQAYAAVKPYLDIAYEGRESVFEFTDAASSRRIRTALNPDGEGGAYILSMDVTEETQTRAALAQSRRRQLAAQVTSGMAHDFSNLLTIILGTQSRLAASDLDPDARRLVEATLAAARRGGDLLNGLAKMTADRRPAPAPVELSGFLSELTTLAEPTLGEGVTLAVDDRTGGARLMLDIAMLQDSLLNLILNAKDAVGGAGRITLTARNLQDTWLELVLEDDGPGFSETALTHALDPFFTTKGDAGSGLGLSTVYDMTQIVGGRMKLGNTRSGGRVVLQLPWRPAQPAAAPGLALLVEDSPDLRQTVRSMLRAEGYSVIEAASVEEARSLVTQVPGLTLILTDITLEGSLTGIDLFDSLPADAPPCYMMTSLRTDHTLFVEAAQRCPVLRKPFDPADLSHLLSTGALPQ
ncbi:sensory box histidine kinase/response regulator [Pseudooceanicola batsensis HTCC2597]|uniref:histidine kinase n=1 Tax=Pseudooceanicola batsensis (strain ATCC BAA-863 / DSM 15984 / KCTC 12145 / HTCC2597) TaxID=252305 RepID=A3TYH1_PSEBH|nr:PAS-domain containing protein [Pseudooceanicola batsensis]EAQ03205.1 sensory box histidine kinase/response regulator [Pseudooceanicola batsensis HTCC2597]